MCFGKITLLLIERFEGRVSGLEVRGQGYFNITSKTQKGQTQELWQGLTGNDACAGVRHRLIPRCLAW